MATLADVFRELNSLKEPGIVRDYALGGATAVLFYAEPARTYGEDVFVLLPLGDDSSIARLTALHEWAASHGFPTESEHVLVHGVPVQFLPAYNALAEEAVAHARTLEYVNVPVKVIGPEHLAALAFQAGGAKRRERAWQHIESESVDHEALKNLLAKYGVEVDIDHGN